MGQLPIVRNKNETYECELKHGTRYAGDEMEARPLLGGGGGPHAPHPTTQLFSVADPPIKIPPLSNLQYKAEMK